MGLFDAGEILREENFINEAQRAVDPTDDEDRLVKLEPSGRFSDVFLNFFAGIVVPYAGASAPDGFLICDGSAVSRSTYARLFAVISTTYGVGDGSTTFNLPDLRGTSVIGVGQKTYSVVKTVAHTSINLSTEEITFGSPHGFSTGDTVSITVNTTMFEYAVHGSTGNQGVDGSGNISFSGFSTPVVGDRIYINSQNSTDFGVGTSYYVISVSGGEFAVSGTPGGSQFGGGNSGTIQYSLFRRPTSGDTLYVYRVSDTVLMLSTSASNAVNGVTLGLTDQGSGTFTFTKSVALSNRTLAQVGGEENHILSIAEMPAHKHRFWQGSADIQGFEQSSGVDLNPNGTGTEYNTESIGGTQSHNNMPPFVALNYIIKT
jgi:microcystin-dependent protein